MRFFFPECCLNMTSGRLLSCGYVVRSANGTENDGNYVHVGVIKVNGVHSFLIVISPPLIFVTVTNHSMEFGICFFLLGACKILTFLVLCNASYINVVDCFAALLFLLLLQHPNISISVFNSFPVHQFFFSYISQNHLR